MIHSVEEGSMCEQVYCVRIYRFDSRRWCKSYCENGGSDITSTKDQTDNRLHLISL